MTSFKVHGIVFRSLRDCCNYFELSYSSAKRLCRTYERARQTPELAVLWLLGDMVRAPDEPRTESYIQELDQNRNRQRKFKLQVKSDIYKLFLG